MAAATAVLHRTRKAGVSVRSFFGGVLTLLAMTAVPASADNLFPNAGELWPNDYLHFFSTDTRPVQVTLRRDMFTNDGEQVTITLPRAWITFASGYDPLKLDRLPDSIQSKSLTIALADGTALSIRSREIAQEQHISLGEAVKRLRAEQYTADIGYVPKRIGIEDQQFNKTTSRNDIIERDGLSYDQKWGQYLGQIGSDLFYFIRCEYSARPDTFCYYRVRAGDNIDLRVSFLDFRFQGGRDYANERLSRFMTAFCKQVEPHCFSVGGHRSTNSP